MNKSSYFKLLVLGVIFLLTACQSVEASPAQAPAEAQEPEVVEAEQPATSSEVESEAVVAEEAAPAEEMDAAAEEIAEEAAPAEETGAVVEEMAEEAAPAEEASTVVEEMAEEEMASAEAVAEEPASLEEEVMTEEVASSNEAAPVEEEAMSDEMAATDQGPTPEQQKILASLTDRGVPPELNNEIWLNSDPLKLADLKGKVVIVEFWTFGCYNCKNVIPSLREWYHEYSDDGLVIIGVHTPEFSYESDVENVKAALVDLDVPYAVAIDNDWATWKAYKKPYNQRYWPSKYFIDKAGNVRHIHIGEGKYDQQEQIIQALLAEQIS